MYYLGNDRYYCICYCKYRTLFSSYFTMLFNYFHFYLVVSNIVCYFVVYFKIYIIMKTLLETQLVRNNMTQTEIEHATPIASGSNGELLICVALHGEYFDCEWIMLSYETGRHSITAPYAEYLKDERVIEHWDGFKRSVCKYIERTVSTRNERLKKEIKGLVFNNGLNVSDEKVNQILNLLTSI